MITSTDGLLEHYAAKKGMSGPFFPRDRIMFEVGQVVTARSRQQAYEEVKDLRLENAGLRRRCSLRGMAAMAMFGALCLGGVAAGFTGYTPWGGEESKSRTMEDSVNTLMFDRSNARIWSASAEVGSQVEQAIRALRAIEASGEESAAHARLTLKRIEKALKEK